MLAIRFRKWISVVVMACIIVTSVSAVLPMQKAEAASYVTIPEGIYGFRTALNGSSVIDVTGGSFQEGTNLQLYQPNATVSQYFEIEYMGNGYYVIRTIYGNPLVFDVENGRRGSQVNVRLWSENRTDAQLWRFYDAGNGRYYIQSKLGYYLDVCGGNTQNGTNIWVYAGNGTASQIFSLDLVNGKSEKIKYIEQNYDFFLYKAEEVIYRENITMEALNAIMLNDAWFRNLGIVTGTVLPPKAAKAVVTETDNWLAGISLITAKSYSAKAKEYATYIKDSLENKTLDDTEALRLLVALREMYYYDDISSAIAQPYIEEYAKVAKGSKWEKANHLIKKYWDGVESGVLGIASDEVTTAGKTLINLIQGGKDVLEVGDKMASYFAGYDTAKADKEKWDNIINSLENLSRH